MLVGFHIENGFLFVFFFRKKDKMNKIVSNKAVGLDDLAKIPLFLGACERKSEKCCLPTFFSKNIKIPLGHVSRL